MLETNYTNHNRSRNGANEMKRIEKNGKWATVEKTQIGYLISVGHVGQFKATDITECLKNT